MLNKGVYRCGFAKTQQEYEAAVEDVFAALDKVEAILAKKRYITFLDYFERSGAQSAEGPQEWRTYLFICWHVGEGANKVWEFTRKFD